MIVNSLLKLLNCNSVALKSIIFFLSCFDHISILNHKCLIFYLLESMIKPIYDFQLHQCPFNFNLRYTSKYTYLRENSVL